ncbi:hypothetical protein HMI55_006160 [Coelomomyces lativittatus]|nr:hypothetical protein HMI55_006160 [Coelomomyces lativittatus]
MQTKIRACLAATRGLMQSKGFSKVYAGVCNRDSEPSKMLEREGIELKVWDPNSVDSIQKCMEGIHSILIVPSPATGLSPVSTNIIQAAERASVHHSLLWSCSAVTEVGGGAPGAPGGRTEELPELEKGKKFLEAMKLLEDTFQRSKINKKVIARVTFPMQSLFYFTDVIQNRGILPLAMGSGRFNPVHLKDVASACAKILSSDIPEEHKNQVYTFTGPHEITAKELVDEFNKTLQAKIELKEMSLPEFRDTLKKLVDNGQMLEYEKDVMVYENYLISINKAAKTTPDLKKILQRDPANISSFFEENKDAFRPGSNRLESCVFRSC